jgi:pyridoxal phosphate enzyme (YggS family)
MAGEIRNKFIEVKQRVAEAARRSNRDSSAVKLVVVTKGQSAEKISNVIEAGAKFLGENYPEETRRKITEMGDLSQTVDWYMIGHLQGRKIKFIVDHFSMIHSIDGVEIARELNSKLQTAGKQLPALLEVNVSGEESKHGFSVWNEADWPSFSDQWLQLQSETKSLHYVGLMTMPPYAEVDENSRQYFLKCRKLLEFLQARSGQKSFDQISMGTSLDYEVAIEEGATFVRVGEAIMGERIYL